MRQQWRRMRVGVTYTVPVCATPQGGAVSGVGGGALEGGGKGRGVRGPLLVEVLTMSEQRPGQ